MNTTDKGLYLSGSSTVSKGHNELVKDRGMLFVFACLFLLFKAKLVAYGSSQAKGQIGAIAGGLLQSHSNTGSEPCL